MRAPKFGDQVQVAFPAKGHPRCVWFRATVVAVEVDGEHVAIKVDFQGWRQWWPEEGEWRWPQDRRTRLVEAIARARAAGTRIGRPPTDPAKLREAEAWIALNQSVGKAARLAGIPPSTLRGHLAKKAAAAARANAAEKGGS